MKHLDLGTIQAFLDGELSGERLENASAHFALCEQCTGAMLEAENELGAVDFAFSAENAYAIPTQRIWARIENELDSLDCQPARIKTSKASIWQGFRQWMPQLAFGGGMAAVVLFSLFSFNAYQEPDNTTVAVSTRNSIDNISKSDIKPLPPPIELSAITTNPQDNLKPTRQTAPRPDFGEIKAVKAGFSVKESSARIANNRSVRPIEAAPVNLKTPLAEERQYLDTINDLAKAVESSDELTMRPSSRVQYEQNVAIMDKAIEQMQRQVRRNPKDENAKRILIASYQNKIDLLNTVAEKTQLMASLHD
jgi:ribosomal protein S15P/S13E